MLSYSRMSIRTIDTEHKLPPRQPRKVQYSCAIDAFAISEAQSAQWRQDNKRGGIRPSESEDAR
jgi:hypothetical protein